ncbi:antigen 5 like allergen Cul n 1-like [Uranotaenia lowii]|uniref:antigen 5 like allergen Cul n 1-like n=1 Tax=Uranotaenia lowii TaxID=190385 RepID=UPI00247ACD06|nr:antigen 5 like allergen Cul n 1-like [Uranotaenia lowii]
MDQIFQFLLLCLVASQVSPNPEVDYCSKQRDLCRPNERHVHCDKISGYGDKCGIESCMVKKNEIIKEALLDRHNQLRSDIALGKYPGFDTAKKMSTLSWDDELALVASYNGKHCAFEHDECRATDTFKMAGQNLAIRSHSSFGRGIEQYKNTKEVVVNMTQAWFDEIKDCNMEYLRTGSGPVTGVVGHFTQIVADRCTKVGCVLVRWRHPDEGKNEVSYYLVCNYSFGNLPPYYESGPTASECKKVNPRYPGLCDD